MKMNFFFFFFFHSVANTLEVALQKTSTKKERKKKYTNI